MSYESWKLTSRILLFLFLNLLSFSRAQDQTPHVCLRNGNYTTNTYAINLNTLLSCLDNGFYNASVGQNRDRANAIVLCRGDRTLDQCRTCVRNAAVGVLQFCPNQKQAVIWYEFCMLRYSNEPIFGTPTNDPVLLLRNTMEVERLELFRETRSRLLDDLRAEAANGSSRLKASGGWRNTSNSEALYALVQCTPDLSLVDCDDCLVRAGRNMQSCCDSARGVKLLMPSCNIRYELYLFYNETRLRQLQVLVPPPRIPSPPGTPSTNDTGRGKEDDNKTKFFIIVVVTILVCIVLAVCCAIFLIKRRKQTPYDITGTGSKNLLPG